MYIVHTVFLCSSNHSAAVVLNFSSFNTLHNTSSATSLVDYRQVFSSHQCQLKSDHINTNMQLLHSPLTQGHMRLNTSTPKAGWATSRVTDHSSQHKRIYIFGKSIKKTPQMSDPLLNIKGQNIKIKSIFPYTPSKQ